MMLTIENIASIAYASNDKTKEAFRVVEPLGKTYRIYADGQIDGFQPGAFIFNYIPALLASNRLAKTKGVLVMHENAKKRLVLMDDKYNPKTPKIDHYDFFEVLSIAERLSAALQEIIDDPLDVDRCVAIANEALL